MPRQARLDAPGTLHHVMARGIERRDIFLGPSDYDDFMGRLEAAVTWGGAAAFAWALIPNHFHLLLHFAIEREHEENEEDRKEANSNHAPHNGLYDMQDVLGLR